MTNFSLNIRNSYTFTCEQSTLYDYFSTLYDYFSMSLDQNSYFCGWMNVV